MYYFSGTSKKYIDAQQFCARVNAYLVEFYDLVQYTEVRMDEQLLKASHRCALQCVGFRGEVNEFSLRNEASIELQIFFRMRQKISA